jgi:hypothetical protein
MPPEKLVREGLGKLVEADQRQRLVDTAALLLEKAARFEAQLGVCRPVFLMSCAPDLPRGIGIHRRDAKTDDQVGPSGKCVGCHKPRHDDCDVCHSIISS